MSRLLAAPLVVLALGALPAAAHTKLIRSNPADGAVLDAAPGHVDLAFAGPVNAPLSKVVVLHDGKEVGRPGPPEALEGGKGLRATLAEGLGAGSYEVRWAALSADGHRIEGSLHFEVKAAAQSRP